MHSFLEDSYTWLTLSFILFAYIVYRFGGPIIIGTLDKRIAAIKSEIETAENLKIEAQEMLAQYQRKQRDAAKEAEKIIKDAKDAAQKIQAQAEEELKETFTRREEQLTQRLKRMEEGAIQEIQAYAATLAMQAVQRIVSEKLDKDANTKLLEKSINSIEHNIH